MHEAWTPAFLVGTAQNSHRQSQLSRCHPPEEDNGLPLLKPLPFLLNLAVTVRLTVAVLRAQASESPSLTAAQIRRPMHPLHFTSLAEIQHSS